MPLRVLTAGMPLGGADGAPFWTTGSEPGDCGAWVTGCGRLGLGGSVVTFGAGKDVPFGLLGGSVMKISMQ